MGGATKLKKKYKKEKEEVGDLKIRKNKKGEVKSLFFS